MQTVLSFALLSVAANAINLHQVNYEYEPTWLSQIDAEADAEADDEWADRSWNDCHCDDHHCDDHYRCPPALERCPGVYQPPGACESILDRAPLCYCNKGFMHTDWDHNISVDDCHACANCGCDDDCDCCDNGHHEW